MSQEIRLYKRVVLLHRGNILLQIITYYYTLLHISYKLAGSCFSKPRGHYLLILLITVIYSSLIIVFMRGGLKDLQMNTMITKWEIRKI